MWLSDNSNKHDNNNKTTSLSIVRHLHEAIQFPRYISPNPFIAPIQWDTEQVLFTMRGDGSLGTRSRKTIHYPSCCRNYDDDSYEEEGIELPSSKEIHGHMSLDTSHSSSNNHGGRGSCRHMSQESIQSTSSNRGFCGFRSILKSHSSSRKCRGYVDRSGSRSQDTSPYSSCYQGGIVDVEGGGLYRSQTSHYCSHNQGKRGRVLTSSRYTIGGDWRSGYMSHNSHSSYQRVHIRGDDTILGSSSEWINLYSWFNVG